MAHSQAFNRSALKWCSNQVKALITPPTARVLGPQWVFFFQNWIFFPLWLNYLHTHRFTYFGALWMSQLQDSNASQALAFAEVWVNTAWRQEASKMAVAPTRVFYTCFALQYLSRMLCRRSLYPPDSSGVCVLVSTRTYIHKCVPSPGPSSLLTSIDARSKAECAWQTDRTR